MVIQALNQDFQVWKPRKIGIKDGLAVVWTSGLSRLLTKVSFRSATTKQEITLPQLAFSVYDLHKKHKTHSQQAVKVLDVAGNWTDVIRSNHSLVAVQQLSKPMAELQTFLASLFCPYEHYQALLFLGPHEDNWDSFMV